MNVKSWTASYKETYTSEKSWEMSPGLTMKTLIYNTISGTYILEKQIEDVYAPEDWCRYGNRASVMNQIVVMSSSDPKWESYFNKIFKSLRHSIFNIRHSIFNIQYSHRD
ncbi:hypothetical protein [Lutimonas vermicola]|uniref:Uncharacterized protein n=1 Tax=Lutimonas vermicola TaxID=414288 RepID=A0ABU9L0B5_9FLAO